MISRTQILEKIYSIENSTIEFREVRFRNEAAVSEPHGDGLSDEIAAFANQRGGMVIFGVSDATRQITGVKYSKPLIHLVSEICRDSIDPPLREFCIDGIRVPDELGEEKTIVYVEIGKSFWLHKSKNGYFCRHGSSKRKMNPDQLLHAAQSRSQARAIPFDRQPVPNTGQNTLAKKLYERLVPDDEDCVSSLRKRRLLVKNNGSDNASVASILMCSNAPDIYIYNGFIQAVRYRGTTMDANYQMDAKDFKGVLDSQIMDAYQFIDKHNIVAARKNVGQEEKSQYSMRAVFEALVNAVVHRDYSKHGSKIRIFLFSDRMEIYSPGELANTLTIDSLPFNQATRNDLLARLLSEVKLDDDVGSFLGRKYFLECRGKGVEIIMRESKKLSGKTPVYKLLGEELRLTIFATEPHRKNTT